MKVEMICTGEEVLSGQIVDTNAAWVADLLMDNGIEMQHRATVGDRLEDLVAIFQERSQHADVIIVNGGLGPTSDDLSAEAMAIAKNEPLVENQQWRQRLTTWFTDNNRPMPLSNLKQALLPASAIMVDNPVGTACGFRVKLNNAWLFFTPGVPFELKRMMTEQFLPFIETEFAAKQASKVEKILTLGTGESTLAEQLQQIELVDGINLGYRSFSPYIEIKTFARGETAIEQLPQLISKIKQQLADAVVSERFSSLAAELHHTLISSNKTLAIAESCTGGMLASQLIDFSGSSAYLDHCVVSYSNAAKTKLLNVSKNTLNTAGAVSIATVEAMATGAREILDSDFALATSGIAGPDGDTQDKPVGTVAIALATRDVVYSQLLQLPPRSRTQIRNTTCAIAYDMLRRKLNNEDVIVNYASYTLKS
ncbi:MAG: CinA family nicotinamide mononucleotide deamidase-related protein [Parashewanella sp.]